MSKRLRWSLAIVFLLVVIALPQFISSDYYMHLLIIIMMNAVLAMTFVILLRAGMLNMSIAAFWGIGAYSSAMLTLKGGLSFWASLPLSIIIAACVAALFGAIIVAANIQADDADKLACSIQHRKAADSLALHSLGGLGHTAIRGDGLGIMGHSTAD